MENKYKCSDWCRFPKRKHFNQLASTGLGNFYEMLQQCSYKAEEVKGWELDLLLEEVRNNKCSVSH